MIILHGLTIRWLVVAKYFGYKNCDVKQLSQYLGTLITSPFMVTHAINIQPQRAFLAE